MPMNRSQGVPIADKLIFLPGAFGDTTIWKPVSDGLLHAGQREFFAYPGFSGVPQDPAVHSIDDLVDRVCESMTEPVDLLAQSMGGVIAIRAALKKPELVRHMVLAVTSGGLDVAALGAIDWRPGFREINQTLPQCFLEYKEDLTDKFGELNIPVLLLWGDADPISPVKVGQRLQELLPQAELVVIIDGAHDLVYKHAAQVIPYIERHLVS